MRLASSKSAALLILQIGASLAVGGANPVSTWHFSGRRSGARKLDRRRGSGRNRIGKLCRAFKISQAGRRPRLDARTRRRENVIGTGLRSRLGRCGCRLRRLLLRRALQSPNGFLERQALRAQHMRGRTLAIADDGRQHDGPIDLTTAALLGSRSRRFENAPQVWRNDNRSTGTLRIAIVQMPNIRRHVAVETRHVDVARLQHNRCLRIFCQRQQKMLDSHLAMPLGRRIVGRACQRGRQKRRHRNPAQLVDDHISHSSASGACLPWPTAASEARRQPCESLGICES